MAQLVKNLPAMWETWFQSLGREDTLEKGKATHSSILAWRIPYTVYSPWACKESDTTERLHFQFSLSYIGEGNGNPLQCSCLENPREGEPGGLLSMGSHRVGHDESDLAAAAAQSV